MTVASLEIRTYVLCPYCGEGPQRVDQLFGHMTKFGPWSCAACGGSYAGTVEDDRSIRVHKLPTESSIKTWDLLKIERAPVFLIVDASRRPDDREGSKSFLYDEHTCPVNWTDRIAEIIFDGDHDPHGVATFIRSVDQSDEYEQDEVEWPLVFPEAFEK